MPLVMNATVGFSPELSFEGVAVEGAPPLPEESADSPPSLPHPVSAIKQANMMARRLGMREWMIFIIDSSIVMALAARGGGVCINR